MPVLRNPFKKSIVVPGIEQKSSTTTEHSEISPSHPRNEGEKAASSIEILKQRRDDEPDTYKLCEVNDSGVYLPPSPPEKRSFWRRSDASTTSLPKHREALKAADNDGGFAISRESFEGYRRSFDISARSPVPTTNSSRASLDMRPSRASFDSPQTPIRQSFDSRMNSTESMNRLPSSIVSESASEEEFRDVELNDAKPQSRTRGFLARLGGHGDHIPEAGETKTRSRSSTLTWRKDANKEAEELGDITADKK